MPISARAFLKLVFLCEEDFEDEDFEDFFFFFESVLSEYRMDESSGFFGVLFIIIRSSVQGSVRVSVLVLLRAISCSMSLLLAVETRTTLHEPSLLISGDCVYFHCVRVPSRGSCE